jgi:hypothetical protein
VVGSIVAFGELKAMIDDQSEPASWEAALAPTHPSLRVLSDEALHCPSLPSKVQITHGTATMADARNIVAAEKRRRVEATTWGGQR